MSPRDAERDAILPSLEEVRGLAADYNLIPVYRHDLADTETPVAAYWRLNGDGPGFLLESVEGWRAPRALLLHRRAAARLGDHERTAGPWSRTSRGRGPRRFQTPSPFWTR